MADLKKLPENRSRPRHATEIPDRGGGGGSRPTTRSTATGGNYNLRQNNKKSNLIAKCKL